MTPVLWEHDSGPLYSTNSSIFGVPFVAMYNGSFGHALFAHGRVLVIFPWEWLMVAELSIVDAPGSSIVGEIARVYHSEHAGHT